MPCWIMAVTYAITYIDSIIITTTVQPALLSFTVIPHLILVQIYNSSLQDSSCTYSGSSIVYFTQTIPSQWLEELSTLESCFITTYVNVLGYAATGKAHARLQAIASNDVLQDFSVNAEHIHSQLFYLVPFDNASTPVHVIFRDFGLCPKHCYTTIHSYFLPSRTQHALALCSPSSPAISARTTRA